MPDAQGVYNEMGKARSEVGSRRSELAMKGPFPGMDPYLESHWGDIHTSLIVYARNQLNEQLPDDLQARVEESRSVQEEAGGGRTVYADVRVVQEPDIVAVAEPILVPVDEPQTERTLEIVDLRDGGRVISAIEFLSPANKVSAEGRILYTRKRREYLDAAVNLVEIDLIREGSFVLAVSPRRLPARCRTPYLICVRRATDPTVAEVYPAPLQKPLPNIRIPLRPTDADAVLRLQPILDACYRDGRYHRMNYRTDPTPQLSEADARWLDELLRGKGLR
jgi:hypothetical protein